MYTCIKLYNLHVYAASYLKLRVHVYMYNVLHTKQNRSSLFKCGWSQAKTRDGDRRGRSLTKHTGRSHP